MKFVVFSIFEIFFLDLCYFCSGMTTVSVTFKTLKQESFKLELMPSDNVRKTNNS